ncbi:MAG TPA: class I SAM-dependent methyltransferase [Solirubrobacteraceae bacterium]
MVEPISTAQRYLPATGRIPLTSLYDPVIALTTRERAFRRAVVAAAATDGAILDVGAGTGTLAIALANAHPAATITGLDGDPQILERARRKAAGTPVTFVEGRAEALPFADDSFDAVTSTLMLHHLTRATKHAALTDVRRVLKPGGKLVIADWGRPHDVLMAAAFLAVRLLDGLETTRDHARGALPKLVTAAGFEAVRTERRWRTPIGTLELITARA